MKKYCVMQFSEGKFSAIEFFKKGNLFKITNHISFKLIDTDDPLLEIKTRLSQAGFKAVNTIFVAKSNVIKNEIKSFPKIPKKELAKVVEREAKRVFPDEEFFHDFVVLEEKEERKGKTVEALISVAPQKYIWEIFTFLRDLGKNPEIITTKIQSFMSLKHIIEREDETFGVLNLSSERSSFVIFKEKSEVIIEREIPITSSDTFGEGEVDSIMIEISRTVQYFKQKNRGFDVSTIYVTGNISNIDEMIDDLNELSPYNFIACNGERLSGKIEIGTGIEPMEFFSTYFDIIGAIFLIKEKEKVNLLPSFYFEKEIFKKRRRNIILSLILMVAILLPTTFVVEMFKRDIGKELEKQKKALQKLEMRRADIERVKSIRERIYNEMLTLGLEQVKIESIVKFFNFITLNTPSGVLLKSAEVKERGKNISVEVRGEVFSETPFLNNRIFNDFYLKMGAFPGIVKTSFSIEENTPQNFYEKAISTAEENLKGEKRKQKEIFRIRFKINLEINPHERK